MSCGYSVKMESTESKNIIQHKDKYTFKGLYIIHPACLHTKINTGQIHTHQMNRQMNGCSILPASLCTRSTQHKHHKRPNQFHLNLKFFYFKVQFSNCPLLYFGLQCNWYCMSISASCIWCRRWLLLLLAHLFIKEL